VGTPTLCSDLPAIHDYAVSTTRVFQSPEEALTTLEERARWTPEQESSAREITRCEGHRFDWKNIAVEVRGVYRELLGE
jgi:hypothetical protein